MRLCIAILLNLFALGSWAQTKFDSASISPDTKSILKTIEKDNVVPADSMGLRFGFLPKDYPLTLLRKKVSVHELKQLTNHNNPIVRCYAFKALTMVSEPDAFSIVIKHLDDSATVETAHGCLLRREFVGDFFVSVYMGYEAIAPKPSHVKTLDSLLAFEPNNLNARSWALRTLKPEEKYYDVIRSIAIKERVPGALIALAKFQKEQDVDLIMDARVTGEFYTYLPLMANFQAIAEFPHPSFLPFLRAQLEERMMAAPKGDCMFLLEAITSYKNKISRELLLLLFQIQDNDTRLKHLEKLYWVLKRNRDPIYDDLRQKLRSENPNQFK